jgi:hypothetical protein
MSRVSRPLSFLLLVCVHCHRRRRRESSPVVAMEYFDRPWRCLVASENAGQFRSETPVEAAIEQECE